MTEFSKITINGKIVQEEEWISYISRLKDIKTDTGTVILLEKIIEAVKKRIPKEVKKKKQKIGVLFSGGVDSTLIAVICKKLGVKPVCYSVGFQSGDIRESPDLAWSRKAAEEFGLECKEIMLGLKEIEKIIKEVVKIVGTDIVKVGVAAVVYAALERAKKDNVKYLFSGLGSEEIFAGYLRHVEAKDINKECWKGLKSMYARDFVRDYAVAKHFGINLLVPLLDRDVIIHAMQIPGSRKISQTNNKLPIRKAALDMGIPEVFAYRKKSAAQYGSNIDKAIKKLAKLHGYRYKKDYLESIG